MCNGVSVNEDILQVLSVLDAAVVTRTSRSSMLLPD